MDFPMAHGADHTYGEALSASNTVVSFSLHNKLTQVSSLHSLDCYLCQNTQQRMGLALRTPADSLAVATHANV